MSRIDSRLALGLERTLKLYAMLRNRPGAPVSTIEVASEKTARDDAFLLDFESKIRKIVEA